MEPVVWNGARYFTLALNPEPWAIGPLDVRRRGNRVYPAIGQNAQLASFQEAVREEIGSGHTVMTGPMKLTFYFWRQRANYNSSNERSVRKHQADDTNMVKALEDALQGVLYANDRDTNDVRGVVVEQGPDVIGKIVIQIEPNSALPDIDLPPDVWAQLERIEQGQALPESDNTWRGPNG